MAVARSRLQARLDAAITAAANPVEAQCLRAERAGLLARQGQLEAAKTVIDELNAQLAWQPNTSLRAWLALAEGLHGYYSALGRGAQASIEQAYMLARELGALKRLHAVAAAWLANMAFANDDMPRMASLVREALDTRCPNTTPREPAPPWWPATPITSPRTTHAPSPGTKPRAVMRSPKATKRICRR